MDFNDGQDHILKMQIIVFVILAHIVISFVFISVLSASRNADNDSLPMVMLQWLEEIT